MDDKDKKKRSGASWTDERHGVGKGALWGTGGAFDSVEDSRVRIKNLLYYVIEERGDINKYDKNNRYWTSGFYRFDHKWMSLCG